MNQDLLTYIFSHSSSLSIQEVLLNCTGALVIGFVIFLSYRFSHSGAVYSAKFNVSLWMLTMVTTMVMCVIGNNIALSLGMVGALSIVRFRTAIKDARDTAYIFWCVAAGICCGISDFLIAALCSGVIFLLMLVIGNTQNNDRYLLVIRGTEEASEQAAQAVAAIYGGKARLRVRNGSKNSVEFIFELTQRLVDSCGGIQDASAHLLAIEGVSAVNFVCQNDEISR